MPFTSGTLRFNGRNLDTMPVEKRNLAIVYQDFALFPHLNVIRNILYGTRYQRIDSSTLQQRLDRLVETLGLERILQRRPHNLKKSFSRMVREICLSANPGSTSPLFSRTIMDYL